MDQFIRDKIIEVKKGDQSAFEDVVNYFQHKIYQHCLRMLGNAHEAEDIAQEAFIRAISISNPLMSSGNFRHGCTELLQI